MQALGDRIILKHVVDMSVKKPEMGAIMLEHYQEQLRYRGIKRALLSTLLNHDMLNLGDLYERVGKTGKPGILFWGDADSVVPFENSTKVQAAIPSIEFHRIPNGSHTPNFEMPELVNPPLIEFLQREM